MDGGWGGPAVGSIGDLGLALLYAGFGGVILWAGRKLNQRLSQVSMWPTVTATILDKGVVKQRLAGGKEGSRWQEHVRYRFTVEGREFEGTGYSALQGGDRDPAAVQRRLDALSDEVTVYYNPANPVEAFIKAGSPIWPFVVNAAGGLALFIGFGKVAKFLAG